MKRWIMVLTLIGASAGLGSTWAADAAVVPVFLRQALPGATVLGQGELRFFGLRIYDARLWVAPGFDAANFGAHPLALELTYHRAFTGAAIAQRSIEEIERQGSLPKAQAERWRQQLAALLPDVQPGERLTGLYLPGAGLQLWHDGKRLGAIDDPALARRFFGIWLAPNTSEPALRASLLGHGGEGVS